MTTAFIILISLLLLNWTYRTHRFFTRYRIVVRHGDYRFGPVLINSGVKVYIGRGWQQFLFIGGCDPRNEDFDEKYATLIVLARQQRAALNAGRRTARG